jgi:hypothetical protein
MSQHAPTLTEQAPDSISDAYWTFKGGSDAIGVRDAKEMLKMTHTARIQGTGDRRWCVKVVLDVDDSEVPEVVERAADAHNLVEVERGPNFDGTLEYVTYARIE